MIAAYLYRWTLEQVEFPYVYRWKKYLPERFQQACRILVRGRLNSVLVEFDDGHLMVTSRNAVWRKVG